MPAISVIIPVYKEEGINRSVEQLLQSSGDVSIQVIVVDGAPDSDSCRLITRPEVMKVHSPPGRACQMNAGADLATADILLFLHADSQLPAGWAQAIFKARESGHAAGAFGLAIDAPGALFRLIEAGANLRCRLTRVPYGDQGIFISRELFKRIGGYADRPFLEDVALMRLLKRQGMRIAILNKRISTSARRWRSEGIFFCSLRNRLVMALYLLGVSPVKLKRFYRSRS